MSEAYHQWLNNLTLWERIDRFFNPSKYSCSTYILDDTVWHIFLIAFTITFIAGIFLWYFTRKYRIEIVENKEAIV